MLSSRCLSILGSVDNPEYQKTKLNKSRVSQILKIGCKSYPNCSVGAAQPQAAVIVHCRIPGGTGSLRLQCDQSPE